MGDPEGHPASSRSLPAFQLSLLAVLVGIVGGLGAVVFRAMIALFHNALFLGRLSTVYDANTHTPPGPWGPLVILVPVVGALGVAFLVQHFAPEARGHGVPEVIDAIYYNRGRIRPVVAAVKALASALSIGSGGSVGREGPIIQIGASFGSTLAQVLRISAWQRVVLVAAGAGSGIAATFNTPVGGVIFALEIMMHEVSARTIVPVAIATATATYVGRLFFGSHPSFVIPALETPYFELTSPLGLLAYVGLGLLMGVMSAAFIRAIYGCEDIFERRIGGSYYRQHLLGMLLVGVLMYAAMAAWGHYYIEGVGYATVQDVLSGVRFPLYLLILLCGLKLLATSLTLGSGASGGIFSPALYVGATLGAAYGTLVGQIPGLGVNVPAFAVAGMAGLVGGVSGAAIAAIVMIFEMTLDYNVIVPMTATVAISYGVRTLLSRDSIYTLKLRRRGHFTPDALHTNPQFVRQARELMHPLFCVESAATPIQSWAPIVARQPAASCVVVTDPDGGGRIVACAPWLDVLQALAGNDGHRTMGDLARPNYVVVRESDSLIDVLARMHARGASLALVADDGAPLTVEKVKGVITKERLADAMVDATVLLTD